MQRSLQRIDSEIAEYVMLHFAKHDMPILPLHDSFLIRSGYEESLEQVMQEAFYHLVGSDVGIEEKKMALPNTMNKDERLVWDKVQAQRANNEPVTDDIYELLAYMETGHEKRLDTFSACLIFTRSAKNDNVSISLSDACSQTLFVW